MKFLAFILGEVAKLLNITNEPDASWIVKLISKFFGGCGEE